VKEPSKIRCEEGRRKGTKNEKFLMELNRKGALAKWNLFPDLGLTLR
jgi:hypothetical protein